PSITLGLATSATGSILDNDAAVVAPKVTISGAPSVVEGGNLLFTVTMSVASSTATTIIYGFGGTATPGLDFNSATTSVTIPAGATTGTITVQTIDDLLVEPTETVTVNLLGTSNPAITLGLAATATGSILDNDAA